jgi:hypothetical protein
MKKTITPQNETTANPSSRGSFFGRLMLKIFIPESAIPQDSEPVQQKDKKATRMKESANWSSVGTLRMVSMP